MLKLRLVPIFLGLALSLVGCTTAPAAPATPVASAKTAEASSEFAPTPYTAIQIRNASAPGRTYEWRREIAGQPATRRVIVFTKVTDENAEMSSVDLDEQGKELAPAKVTTSTWEELRQHAQFPRDSVQISEETVTVPAGTFECLKYTVTRGEAEGMTFLFAKSLPGAPVLFYKTVDGKRVMTSTLVRHVPGRLP
jgi:hypothetical protein